MKPNICASDTIFNDQEQQFHTPIRLKKPANESTIKQFYNHKSKTCNCQRVKCLKLYCDCLANGELCGNECSCFDCHNNSSHLSERNVVVEQLVEKNQESFVKKQQIKKGCNCRKSHCQKKYCECFNAGVLCSELCRCDDCQNCEKHKLNSQQINQVKQMLNQCELVNSQFLVLPKKIQ